MSHIVKQSLMYQKAILNMKTCLIYTALSMNIARTSKYLKCKDIYLVT